MARCGTAGWGWIPTLLLLCGGCSGEEAGAPPATTAGAGTPGAAEAPGPRAYETWSQAGHYRVSLRPEQPPARLHRLHAWVVELATEAGEPFAPTRLAVGGGMPQHAHGFPTQPRVTRSLGPGRYRIDGVKFHMSGDWTFRLEIVGPAGPDVAVLVVNVGP